MWITIVLVALAVVLVTGWAVRRARGGRHPEAAASHDRGSTDPQGGPPPIPPYRGTGRPAGPGAEDMAVPDRGRIGPSAPPAAEP